MPLASWLCTLQARVKRPELARWRALVSHFFPFANRASIGPLVVSPPRAALSSHPLSRFIWPDGVPSHLTLFAVGLNFCSFITARVNLFANLPVFGSMMFALAELRT